MSVYCRHRSIYSPWLVLKPVKDRQQKVGQSLDDDAGYRQDYSWAWPCHGVI